MAKASVETTKTVTLTLSEDEAHAIFALVGQATSTEGQPHTGQVYDALTKALGDGDYYFASKYNVGDRSGNFIGTLYLHPATQ